MGFDLVFMTYTEAEKEMIMNAYQERSSMRGVCRIFGVGFPTLSKWLKSAGSAQHRIDLDKLYLRMKRCVTNS